MKLKLAFCNYIYEYAFNSDLSEHIFFLGFTKIKNMVYCTVIDSVKNKFHDCTRV